MNFLFLCSELVEKTLQNISFECNTANRMLAIVGPVGAGKVSLSLNLKIPDTLATYMGCTYDQVVHVSSSCCT